MDKEFLLNYLNTDSPSTLETEALKVWIEEINRIGLLGAIPKTDNYGNTYVRIPSATSDFKVVLDAHCDEISWVVRDITEDGYIMVKRNGGTYNEITPNTRVKIMTESGVKVHGFFGSLPVHYHENFDSSEHKLYVDVACSSKEEVLRMGIEIGNYIVANREAEIINNKVIGKSLDDKIGGYILVEVLKRIKQENIELPFDLYVVNSVQEELGLRGAHMVTETIKPDVALVFDLTFDTSTPNTPKDKYGDFKLDEGIVFRKGYDVHPNFLKLMTNVAKETDIPYKILVGGRGGTNTNPYNLSNGGVVTGTLSIPLRGMHSQNEMVSLYDVETSIDYIIELLKRIKNNHNFKLL